MIAEIGHIFLIAALIISSFAGFLPLWGLIRKDYSIYRAIGKLTSMVFFLVLFSFLSLIYCFLVDDFSVAYVANNSNQLLPIYYKLTATWGAHEGSLLLWILSLSFWAIFYIWLN